MNIAVKPENTNNREALAGKVSLVSLHSSLISASLLLKSLVRCRFSSPPTRPAQLRALHYPWMVVGPHTEIGAAASVLATALLQI